MIKRALLPFFAAVCGLSLMTGCGSPPAAKAPAVQLAAGVASGQPAGLRQGAQLGYWVWQTDGGIWHVRTTTAKNKHKFQGRITPVQGTQISDPRKVGTGKEDKIGTEGAAIVFQFVTQGDEDGFDFRAVGNGCIEFDLRVDGKQRSQHVAVGAGETRPATSNFIACQ